KVDAGLLGVVINTLPLDFLGLSSEERQFDEAAEIAQCRAACGRDSKCRDFTYVRPNGRQPVGVCHLKALADAESFGSMSPVSDERNRGTSTEETSTASPQERTPDRIVFQDSDGKGSVRYGEEDARATPLTLKFLAPVAEVKARLHASD